MNQNDPRVLATRPIASGRFLRYRMVEWMDAYGVKREWESADRQEGFGAVLIVPIFRPSGRLLLIRQFRPPAGREVIEFPAGIIDDGESPEAAARRELREETGYQAANLIIHPPSYTTPGMSDEAVYMVEAFLDENAFANEHPETSFDPSEMISTALVDAADLYGFYRRESERGVAFDAKLAAYILARSSAEQ